MASFKWPPTGVGSINGDSSSAQTISILAKTGLKLSTSAGATVFTLGDLVTLTDGATVALDASLGTVFYLSSTTNPTISAPTNATNLQVILIIFKATSADRTLSLTTGAGGFSFGSGITTLNATTNGTNDLITAVYFSTLGKWIVGGYEQGYS